MTTEATIRIQQADFDIAQEIAALTKGRSDVGAVVTFSGICRGSENGEPIAALTLEHYPGMAEAEIRRHADAAMSRWPLTGLTIVHRVGRITPGENIVLVLAASQHRQAAFHAADFLMDLRGAIEGGAAGWCFHNGSQRDAPQGRPRRSFDLGDQRLFEQLDPEERKFIETIAREHLTK
jgi:molybdopterin synthase catalytic subunit